jgi:HAMP domain-containing protein
MLQFNNRKMAGRILLAFAAVLALNVIGGEYGLKQLTLAHESEHDATSVQAPLQTLDELRASLNSYNRAQFEYLAARNGAERLESTENFRAAGETIQRSEEKYGDFLWNRIAKGMANSEEERAFSGFKEDLARYLALGQESLQRASLQRASADRSRIPRYEGRRRRAKPAPAARPGPEAQDLLFGEEKNALTASVSDLQGLAALRMQSEQTSARASAALYSSSEQQGQIEVAFCFAAGVIVALALALVVVRDIARPIERAVVAASTIGAVDLSGAPVEIDPRDEAGELAKHVNEMQRTVKEMMGTVANRAQRIAAASAFSEISSLAAELQELASHFQSAAPPQEAELHEPVRSAEWGRIDDTVESANGHTASALTLAPRSTPRSGVARIHARLLESGTKPEPHGLGPSSVSAGRPG